MKRMLEGLSSRHRQSLRHAQALAVPGALLPGSSSLPQTPSLLPSLEITGSHHLPLSLLDREPSQCLLEHAAPRSLPISTRARQNRTGGRPRSHSSTSVYLEPPLASFLLVDKTKLKAGSEHLLEEPYPEVPAGESDLSMTLGSGLAPVLLEPGLGTNPGEPGLQLTGISRLCLLCKHQTMHVLVLNRTPRESAAGSVGSRSKVERSRNGNKSIFKFVSPATSLPSSLCQFKVDRTRFESGVPNPQAMNQRPARNWAAQQEVSGRWTGKASS